MYAVSEIKVVSMSVREFAEDALCRTPEDIKRLWADTVAGARQYDPEKEQFAVFMLNARNRLKSWQIVTQGIMDATLIHPREVYRPAIIVASAAIIIAHNHPSGDATPSAEDLAVTRQMVEAGRMLGIPCMDHVIIAQPFNGNSGFVSLRESGLVIFNS